MTVLSSPGTSRGLFEKINLLIIIAHPSAYCNSAQAAQHSVGPGLNRWTPEPVSGTPQQRPLGQRRVDSWTGVHLYAPVDILDCFFGIREMVGIFNVDHKIHTKVPDDVASRAWVRRAHLSMMCNVRWFEYLR